MYLVYLKYWTLNYMPLMVYPKVLFHPNFSIKGQAAKGLCFAAFAIAAAGSPCNGCAPIRNPRLCLTQFPCVSYSEQHDPMCPGR